MQQLDLFGPVPKPPKQVKVQEEAKPIEPAKPVPASVSVSMPTPASEPISDNIPPDSELNKRQYYTMGEVATMFNANQSQIRFWENEFDILQPKKNKKGDRYFRPIDIKNLQLIQHLLQHRKFTIEGAKDYLKNNKQKATDRFSAVQSLQQLKSFLIEIKNNL